MWKFSSKENQKRFRENPERYAPQYGGYCAYAVSRNYTYPIDPQAFSIVDGKLYLNYSLRVRGWWNSDRDGNIEQANINWEDLSSSFVR